MRKSSTLTLSPAQQLVDINEGIINFTAEIHVESKTQAPFSALILNDEDLAGSGASGKPFQDAVNGAIVVSIQNDNDAKTNWYLCLKAPADNLVTVDIDKKKILPRDPDSLPPESLPSNAPTDSAPDAAPNPPSKFSWIYIVIIIALAIVVIYFIYRYFSGQSSARLTPHAPVLPAAREDDSDFLSQFDSLPSI